MKWFKAHRNQLLTITCILALLLAAFFYITNSPFRTFIQTYYWRILAAFSPIFAWIAAKKRRGPAPADVLINKSQKYAAEGSGSHTFVRVLLRIPWVFWFLFAVILFVLSVLAIFRFYYLPKIIVVSLSMTLFSLGIVCFIFAGITPSGEKDN